MARLIDRGLKELKRMTLEMGLYSHASYRKAINALNELRDISGELIKRSYQLMMKREEVSSLAIELIARFQPLASDLRYIKSIMEIAYDYLRIGRYSADISLAIRDLAGEDGGCDVSIAEKLINSVDHMITLSIELLESPEEDKAQKIIDLDNVVDEEYRRVIEKVIEWGDVKCGLLVAFVARYLERIGDHAYYIADSIYYYLNGYRIAKV